MPELAFSDLNLHDSRVLLLRLSLDLEENELLELFLQYVEAYYPLKTSLKRMTFIDCREIRIVGHLGFVRGSSILQGDTIGDLELLDQTRSKWERLAVRDLWQHFRLLTNTGTEIDIIAAGFKFEDVDESQVFKTTTT